MKYSVELKAPVKIMARCEIKVEAPDEDTAWETGVDVYKEIVREYDAAMKAYRRGETKTYPECPYTWEVDSDDIEAGLEEREIEVDDVEEDKEG
jgi:hypothetical protein